MLRDTGPEVWKTQGLSRENRDEWYPSKYPHQRTSMECFYLKRRNSRWTWNQSWACCSYVQNTDLTILTSKYRGLTPSLVQQRWVSQRTNLLTTLLRKSSSTKSVLKAGISEHIRDKLANTDTRTVAMRRRPHRLATRQKLYEWLDHFDKRFRKLIINNLVFIGPCIIVIVEE